MSTSARKPIAATMAIGSSKKVRLPSSSQSRKTKNIQGYLVFMVREKVDDAKLIMIMYLQTGFKEKIVQMYEVLLRGEDPQISFGQQFWNEFFLLKPKVGNKNTW